MLKCTVLWSLILHRCVCAKNPFNPFMIWIWKSYVHNLHSLSERHNIFYCESYNHRLHTLLHQWYHTSVYEVFSYTTILLRLAHFLWTININTEMTVNSPASPRSVSPQAKKKKTPLRLLVCRSVKISQMGLSSFAFTVLEIYDVQQWDVQLPSICICMLLVFHSPS